MLENVELIQRRRSGMRSQGRASVVFMILLMLSAISLAQQASSPNSSRPTVVQGTLIAPGSIPFHLKATITEGLDPAPVGRVEMFWVAPDKWRREIQSDIFGQTLVVNGGKVFEQDADDYFPLGLQTIVTAMVDPRPVLDAFRPGDMAETKANGASSESGAVSFGSKMIGMTRYGLIEMIGATGHSVGFTKYENFNGNRVARRLICNDRDGDGLTAQVTELNELKHPDESLFSIAEQTPKEKRIRSVSVPEAELNSLGVGKHEIIWPQVLDGATTGIATFYISMDRAGQVREAIPIHSDNMLTDDSAIRQIMKWKFRPVVKDGAPVQMESLLTFDLNTRAWGPANPLSDGEVRKLATNIVEPVVAAGTVASGTTCRLRVAIDDEGKLIETIRDGGPPAFSQVCYSAVLKWRFNPIMQNGEPRPYRAEIKFQVP
jgi:hypothetical protein